MTAELEAHLFRSCAHLGYSEDDAGICDLLIDKANAGKPICEQAGTRRRWWTEYFTVLEIDGKLIGFGNAYSDGDMSASERGWQLSLRSVVEVEAKEVTATIYVPKASPATIAEDGL